MVPGRTGDSHRACINICDLSVALFQGELISFLLGSRVRILILYQEEDYRGDHFEISKNSSSLPATVANSISSIGSYLKV
mmetsp:Transcript_21498/g.24356  ORF Transcript_21498/g.24356 Transcript_21498/m.24356 type:complete len:80 (+) Transcript_21498:60-299(+)